MSKKEEKKAKKAEKKAMKAEKKADKKPMEINVSKAIINSVCAVVCVAIVAVSISVCTNKITENKIAVAEMKSSGTVSSDISSGDSSYDDYSGDVSSDVAGDVAGDATGDVTGDVAGDASADAGSTDAAGDSQGATNTNASSGSKAPSSVADVLKYYNTATKKAVDKKVLFSKERTSVEKSYEAGVALKTFKGLVYQFMGVGEENKYVKSISKDDTVDSYHKYLQASSLTAANVKNATCVDKNGIYTITIQLKDGSSSVQGGTVKAAGGTALDKCGISQGEGDKDYWDHKNAQNVFDAIDDLADSANISESYSNAVVTATINSKTGNITGLVVKFDFKFDISNVMGSKGAATGTSTVTFKDFKW